MLQPPEPQPQPLLLLLLLLLTGFIPAPCSGQAARPHIVFIVADDLGYNDVGYHGSVIRTPSIDRLARSGVRLESYYVQPVCTPSRSQIMSGLYQIHTGLQHGIIDDGMASGLPLNVSTLADRLKAAGYATHIVGKWHLGYFERSYLPTRRGFDSFYGFLGGSEDYYSHVRCDRTCGFDFYDGEAPANAKDTNGKYSTWLFAQRAEDIVRRHNRSQPLFLYLAFQCPHGPLQSPRGPLRQYSGIADENRRTFAGMVTAMDAAIGRVETALRAADLWRDTLLVFTTDNGGDPTLGASNSPYRGGKGSYYEGGIRGVGFVAGPYINASRAGAVVRDLIHVSDWYPTLVRLASGGRDGGDSASMRTDGVDQWSTLNEGRSGLRQEILHNIDTLFPENGQALYNDTFSSSIRAAIRQGDWKLMTGFIGGASRNNSTCGINSTMCVGGVRNVWLYNITADPTESVELSEQQPQVVRQLLDRLASHQASAVPPFFPKRDPRAQPQFNEGFWRPWM